MSRPVCARCGDQRYRAALDAVSGGLPVTRAADAAGLSRVSIYRHARECRPYGVLLGAALEQGGRRLSAPQRLSEAPMLALPAITAAIREGASRREAARRAGVNPNTAQGWFSRRPDYRAAVSAAEAGRRSQL